MPASEDLNKAADHVEITVKRSEVFNGPGKLTPFSWLYECEGPDGRRFDNRSITELRRVLKRRYGKAVQIVEPWKNLRGTDGPSPARDTP